MKTPHSAEQQSSRTSDLTPMANWQHFIGTYFALQQYPDPMKTRSFLEKMANLAGEDPEYSTRFQHWLEHGSTILLRSLAEPLGYTFDDLALFNQVHAIDSAHLHRFDPLPDC